MNFIIDTKFNVGDRVYAVNLYHDYYASRMPYIINDIIIDISNRGVRIAYYAKQDGYTECFPEDWLFSTYEECAQWCKEHN